ncbi:MAG: hypothetical protein KAS04_00240, partial [Candidatus Aenigmarchaeota archaeon]|nr:hypothetical protein [Candidatus Aenigmarchaeota archaeon]
RVVNIERLLECLDFNDVESFRKWYQETLNEKLACENHRREVYWSKAAVIGGEEWLPQAAVDSGLKHCKVKRFQTDTGEDVYYLWVFIRISGLTPLKLPPFCQSLIRHKPFASSLFCMLPISCFLQLSLC